jgi:hypothetical protein
MPFGPCPKHGCFQIVEVLGRWRRGDAKEHMRVSSGEGEGDGEYVAKGARVVGCA